MTSSVSLPAPQRAHVIGSDAEALEAAAAARTRLAAGASARDAERRLPFPELSELRRAGLLAVTVPHAHGGAEVRFSTLAEVLRLLAAGDPNVAQIPHSHFVYLEGLRLRGTEEQQRLLFGEVIAGAQIANAQSERGTKTVRDIQTRLVKRPGGALVLTGEKHYATGSLFADWLAVLALDGRDRLQVAYVPSDAPGVEIVDDWDGMGQRTTGSGTVRLRDVAVDPRLVLAQHVTLQGPQLYGARAQLLHAAIDAGIAAGALAEAVDVVQRLSRPWFEAGVDRAADDPLVVHRFGELTCALRAAEALVARAAEEIDDLAGTTLTAESAAGASLAVATAKIAADRAAIEITNALFEVAGTRSSLDELNLHRHWRNARTHTLHDPVRWKVQHLGRHTLNGLLPEQHSAL
ncbi:MAG: SfnB family sulfur acquisition oxidoreductase [Solirubrobacteraceae bacterium]|nr:SfnB family sulfur acquisition oxidoreductase [Solirubrobacteraceae bacterium]